MREAVTLSNVSRILPSPLGPVNALKTKIDFEAFSNCISIILFGSPLGLWFHGATVGPLPCKALQETLRHNTTELLDENVQVWLKVLRESLPHHGVGEGWEFLRREVAAI